MINKRPGAPGKPDEADPQGGPGEGKRGVITDEAGRTTEIQEVELDELKR
ncbi:hypothetical protein [Streptomyces gobiensis]|nr:hypothetical protein [Streptomyces gobiensis]UGY91237.1 hypothetical protein test1122_05570 [Streptomyces gobiensis]